MNPYTEFFFMFVEKRPWAIRCIEQILSRWSVNDAKKKVEKNKKKKKRRKKSGAFHFSTRVRSLRRRRRRPLIARPTKRILDRNTHLLHPFCFLSFSHPGPCSLVIIILLCSVSFQSVHVPMNCNNMCVRANTCCQRFPGAPCAVSGTNRSDARAERTRASGFACRE